MMPEPAYLHSCQTGLLRERIRSAQAHLACCTLCPRSCAVNRAAGERGFCQTGRYAAVASSGPHFGEEAPLVGRFGSGTIFFAGCNLLCAFCQNYDISHESAGSETSPAALADIMVSLQARGVHNINFVTPSHVVPQIVEALPQAIERGLSIPLVYNSGGYDCVETLQLLEGIIDIYMPDIKFFDQHAASRYGKAPDYPAVVRAAVKEMYRQVGDLRLDRQGHARRGLLVRHLVMPHDRTGPAQIMEFLAREVSPHTYVNIMDQYQPCGSIGAFPELARRITDDEYQNAVAAARAAGLSRVDRRQRSFLLHWR